MPKSMEPVTDLWPYIYIYINSTEGVVNKVRRDSDLANKRLGK